MYNIRKLYAHAHIYTNMLYVAIYSQKYSINHNNHKNSKTKLNVVVKIDSNKMLIGRNWYVSILGFTAHLSVFGIEGQHLCCLRYVACVACKGLHPPMSITACHPHCQIFELVHWIHAY